MCAKRVDESQQINEKEEERNSKAFQRYLAKSSQGNDLWLKDLQKEKRKDILEFRFDSQPVCILCSEKVKGGEMVKVLTCKHLFHSQCLNIWLSRYKNNCPTCRTGLN